MEEEGKNRPLKHIRVEEEDNEDIISKLPDCLLIEILSRLPYTKYAIRTATLSKRWIHIWTYVPNLAFFNRHVNNSLDFYSYVDKTLTQCSQSKLNKFTLNTCFSRYYHHQESCINNWIRYAVNRKVDHLRLFLSAGLPPRGTYFPLDECVFINSCFTNLTLSGCAFNPTRPIRWENLRSLHIGCGKLDEDIIENVLSGSLVLETLALNHCYGYNRINITSKSLKKLVLNGYCAPEHDPLRDVIRIKAPNILTLKIKGVLWLRKLLLLNVSSLAEAHLDYWNFLFHDETTSEKAEEKMLQRLILNLRHVKDLNIGTPCLKVFDRLKAKGFISPPNLKVVDNGLSSLL